ncbi:glycosyltransferase family 4 protein [Geobacter hydrogenophilus]|nr:glycosyltransferase family 1 protein [Geobacter hydrogenophilus]
MVWRELRLPIKLWRICSRYFDPLARSLIERGCDLWIFPSQDCWGYQVQVPALVSILDLMHRYERRFPEVGGRWRYQSLEHHYQNVCRWAKGVLVDSEAGKKQVFESYGMPLENIHILPFVPPQYLTDIVPIADFHCQYNLPEKFLFYPAQFWEHKNHVGLLEALALVKRECHDIHLVLVGAKKNAYSIVRETVTRLNLESNVHVLGYVPQEHMPEFYRRARALVMPTFFGPTNIPPLEGFLLGCPVAVSNVYGMPEQAGDAALFFDPGDVDDMSAVLRRLWLDDELCAGLVAKGKERSVHWRQPQFNQRLADILEELLIKSGADSLK